MMDLSSLRKEYRLKTLDFKDLSQNPIDQFKQWFDEACHCQLTEPNAMVLSTVSANGEPSSRTVLLKHYDQEGFVFFTNYGSQKAQEIEGNPRVSLVFPWLDLERQVIVHGVATKVPREMSKEYFLKRPFASQVASWSSRQSSVLESRTILENRYEEMKKRFMNEPMDVPPFWGGYRIAPSSIEFWQGRENRFHDRFRYRKESDSVWMIERLSP